MSAPAPPDPCPALLRARIVAGALLVSGILLAVVGTVWTLPAAGSRADGGSATAVFAVWVAAAIGGTAGWWVVWRWAAEGPRGDPARVVRGLTLAWALLEAQMMVAFVASLLGGTPMLLVPGLTIFALGLLLSLPRREWFEAPERRKI